LGTTIFGPTGPAVLMRFLYAAVILLILLISPPFPFFPFPSPLYPDFEVIVIIGIGGMFAIPF
jgi:hypothetical protein